MKIYKYLIYLPVIFTLIIAGCSSQSPYKIKNDNDQSAAKVIAVLVVNNKSADSKASVLLRKKILDELYFKGYTKLSPEVIDKKLEPLYSKENMNGTGIIAPQVLKELVGADAVMYCTLIEVKRSVGWFYAPVSIAVRCELRSTQTGEIFWSAEYKSTSRNFDITSNRLEIKSRAAFEAVMEEVVNKVMETLPDGPKLQG
jgi:hypothetical protein